MGGGALLAPTAPPVLQEYKASLAVTEIGTWGDYTVALTALGAFSTQVNN